MPTRRRYTRLERRLDHLKLRRYALSFSSQATTLSPLCDGARALGWLCQLEYILHDLGHISGFRRLGPYAGKHYAYPALLGDDRPANGYRLTQAIADLGTLQGPNEVHATAVAWVALRSLGVTRATYSTVRKRLLDGMRVNLNANANDPQHYSPLLAEQALRHAVKKPVTAECATEVLNHLTTLRILDP
jgi:hypothetical protein